MNPTSPWTLRLFATSCLTLSVSAGASALPVGGVVSGGSATISSPSASQLNVAQHSNRAVIDWRSFDVGTGERVSVAQPNNASILLNRVNNAQASRINGQITANGQVIIANPNGVIFGKGARVDVGGLIATSSKIDAGAFMQQGVLTGTAGNPDAKVENAGTITAAKGGLVALVAPEVANSGMIVAHAGKVQLAAGDTIVYDLYGDGLLSVAASTSEQKAIVGQNGTIDAAGGTVALSAAQAGSLIDSVVNMDGVVEATSLKGAGGTVTLSADTITLGSAARIHADGAAGGGTIEIGGGYQGSGPLPWAKSVSVAEGAAITASGTRGNAAGGKVVLWSHEKTGFAGAITAKGKGSGAGGTVETSSKGALDIAPNATVDASSDSGPAGSWLLDPGNITLIHATDGTSDANDSVTGGTHAPTSGNDSTVSDFTINAALNGGTSVTLLTTSTGTGATNGNITNTGSPVINYTGSSTLSLTLKATGDILLSNTTIQATGSGKLNTILWSDSDNNTYGLISLTGSTITSNGGKFVAAGGLDNGANGGTASDGIPDGYAYGNGYNNLRGITLNSSTVTTGSGSILLRGRGNDGFTSLNTLYGIYLNSGTKLATTGTGSITLNGTAGGGGTNNYGIYLNGNGTAGGTAITTVDGAISLTGLGQGGGSNSYGIAMDAMAGISSTGIGTITLTGTGASGGTTGNNGITLTGAGTLITSANGAIGLTGIAGGTGASNYGIDLAAGAQITSTGTGTITLSGAGGNGTTNNYGIYLNGNGTAGATAITTANGAVSLTGIGQGSSSSNNGIRIDSGGAIASTGSGTITLSGTGSNGTAGNVGILLTNTGTLISSTNGAIALTGKGGPTATANSNLGIQLTNGAQIASTGTVSATAATITLTGIGGGGTTSEAGIDLDTAGTLITTKAGNILLSGTGGAGSGNNPNGIYMASGAAITSTGGTGAAGSITLNGTGSSGTSETEGIYLTGSSTNITSGYGAIALNGTGGTGSSFNGYGVYLGNGAQLVSAGTGASAATITLSGSASAGVTSGGFGVYINGTGTAGGTAITTADGAISLTGTGNGSSTSGSEHGIVVDSAAKIASTGSGTITLTGTGANVSGGNVYGISITGTGTNLTSTAAISLTGVGRGSGSYDYGIYTGTGSQITSTGGSSSTINLTGTGPSGGVNNQFGISLSGTINSTSGNISVTGIGGTGNSGTGSVGVYTNNASIISNGSASIALTGTAGTGGGDMFLGTLTAGSSAMTGNVTLNADSLTLSSSTITTQNNIVIKPRTASTTIGVNGGAGTLSLTSATLAELFPDAAGTGTGRLIIGDAAAGTGAVNVNAWDLSGKTYGAELHGGSITQAGAITWNQGNAILLDSRVSDLSPAYALNDTGPLASTLTLKSAGNVVISGNMITDTGTGALNTILWANSGGLTNGGAVYVNSLTLNTRGGNFIAAGGLDDGSNGGIANDGTPDGYAYGNASYAYGLNVIGGSITTGAGNIVLRGHGYDNTGSSNHGGTHIYGTALQTTSGNVTLNGTGGLGGGGDRGILDDGNTGAGSTITTATGAISLKGVGGSYYGGSEIGIQLSNAAKITSMGTGTITLAGTGGGTNNTNEYGVYLSDSGTLITSAYGAILLNGTGGSASNTSEHGIFLTAGAQVISNGTGASAASITLNGTGGNGTSSNDGIYLNGNGTAGGTAITTVDGAVTLTGIGKGTTTTNYGLLADAGAQITSSGTGAITLAGTASNSGTGSNIGALLTGANTRISSASGAINLTGIGGAGTGGYGVQLAAGAKIASTGSGASAGAITLSGTGGAGTTPDYGIYINGTGTAGGTAISTVDGAVTLTGIGQGSGTDNYGVFANQLATISSTGLTKGGSITLNGTGAAGGTGNGRGVYLYAGSISSVNGDIALNGVGGGSGSGSYGVSVANAGTVTSTGTGALAARITLNGTGGNGTSSDHGIYLNGNGTAGATAVTTVDGAISLTGVGKGTGSGNNGILIDGNASVAATGTAGISLSGSGGNGTDSNTGIGLNIVNITSATGSILLAGIGGTATGTSNNGILLYNNAIIQSTGATGGNITLNGTSSIGTSTQDNGILINGTSTVIQTNAGAIALNGVGHAVSGSVGVGFNDTSSTITTASGAITLTGGVQGINFNAGTNTIGALNDTGNISFVADTLINTAFSATTRGNITVKPYTTSMSIGVNGGSGALSLTSAILTKLNPDGAGTGTGRLIIGDAVAGTGAINVNAWDLSGKTYGVELHGGSITQAGAITWNQGNSILLDSRVSDLSPAYALNDTGSLASTLTLKSAGNVVISGNMITDTGGGKLNTILWGNAANTGSGAVSVTNLTLNTQGGNFTAAGGLDDGSNGGTAGDGVPDGYAWGNSAYTSGVTLSGSTITTGAGAILLRGQGYNLSSGVGQDGVYLTSGSKLTTGAGAITLSGTAGSGAGVNFGVYLYGNGTAGGTAITTATGAISLTGLGAGSGTYDYGVYLNAGGQIVSTGSGSITLSGTGGNGNNNDYGICLDGTGIAGGTAITTVDGAVLLTGIAQGTSGSDIGIDVNALSSISSTGTGTITLSGTGSANATGLYAHGVYLNSALLSSVRGAVTITGVGGGTSASGNNYGIQIQNASQIASTGTGATAATIMLNGTGGAGTSNNIGIYLSGNGTAGGTAITTVDGAVSLNGAGKGTGVGNYGIGQDGASLIASAGTGTITLSGSGGNGNGAYNLGVLLTGSGTLLSSAKGGIQLTGTGGGTGSNEVGIWLQSGAQVTSTGTGASAATITLSGTGASGGTSSNFGFYLNGNGTTSGTAITTVDGAVSLTGIGRGTSDYDKGIFTDGVAKIASTGTGAIGLVGTGASGTSYNYGIDLNNGVLSAVSGGISLSGTGGSGSSTSNHGIAVESGSSITTTSTTAGNITLNGISGSNASANNDVGIIFATGSITASGGSIALSGTTHNVTNTSGIDFYNGANSISAGAGNIVLTGIAGSTADIYSAATTTIGSGTMAGNITLNADTLSLASFTATTKGSITVRPRTASTTIGVNGGAGTLSLTSAVLGILNPDAAGTGAGKLIIGDAAAGTGAINVNAWDLSGKTYGVELHGGSITQAGAITWNQGNSILLDSRVSDLSPAYALNDTGSLASTLTLKSAGNVVINGNMITDTGGGKLNTLLWSNSANTGLGAVSVTNLTLNTQGGNFIAAGGLDDGSNGGTAGDGVPDGYAWGNASYTRGVTLNGSALTTGSGNILLRGQGYNLSSASNDYGVYLTGGAKLTSTSGNMTLNGIGGSGTSGNHGIYISGNGTTGGTAITTVDGAINLNGTAQGSTTFNYGILLDSNATIQSTGTGTISMTGVGALAGTLYDYGIRLTSNSLVTSQKGAISLNGTGGGSSGNDYGIVLASGAQITSTGTGATAATISLTGTGSASGTGYDYGIYLNGNGTAGSTGISTVDGAVSLTGIGKGTNAGNYGTYMDAAAQIAASGTGALTLSGTGSATGTNNNIGVYLTGGASILNNAAPLNIKGVGQGSGTQNYGVLLASASKIAETSGGVTLSGTGGNGTSNNYGIYLSGNGTAGGTAIGTVDGAVSLTGIGQGTTANNAGVYMDAGSQVSSNGTGTLSLFGTGASSGTTGNHGVYLTGAGTLVTAAKGAIGLMGTGAGSGGSGYGIGLGAGAQIASTGTGMGAATITLNGAGTGAGASNHGVQLTGSGTSISSVIGAISLTGTASGTDHSYGIQTAGNSSIVSTGTGANAANITLNGTSAGGTAYTSYGVDINTSTISANAGNITVTGNAPGTGGNDNGIVIEQGPSIVTTSTTAGGNITLSGYATSPTTSSDSGIILSSGTISTGYGNISLTGSTHTGSTLYGLNLAPGSAGSTVNSATGAITFTGLSGTAGAGSKFSNLAVGSSSATGAITLVQDSLSTAAFTATSFTTQGNIVVKPYTATTSIGVNGGAGTLNLTSAYLATFAPDAAGTGTGKLIIGDAAAGTGAINVNAWDLSGKTYGVELHGGSITQAGAITWNQGNSILLDSRVSDLSPAYALNDTGSLASTLTLKSAGSITISGNKIVDSGTGALNTILWSDTGGAANGGAIYLYASTINTNGGKFFAGGGLDDGSNGGMAGDGIPDGYAYGTASNTTGIFLQNSSVTTGSGNITLNAHGYDSGAYGVRLDYGSALATTSGGITLRGTGGNGTSANYGIVLSCTTACASISTANGAIQMYGLAQGTANGNHGIVLNAGTRITSTGSGSINLYGTGSATGTGSDFGIWATGSGTVISAANGAITLNGTGAGTGTSNYGIDIGNGAQIVSTGTGANAGTITLNGTGGAGTSNNYGIYINGNGTAGGTAISTVDGAVSLAGVGRGTTTSNHGILVDAVAKIASTGTGAISLTGTGSSAGTSSNQGIQITGNNTAGSTQISTVNGAITLNGTGGGTIANAGTTNNGVYLNAGALLVSTGTSTTGSISLYGTGGNGSSQNMGIWLGNNSGGAAIQSVNGAALLNGSGGATGSSDYGTYLVLGGNIVTTGTGGSITLLGTGGSASAGGEIGVVLNNSGGSVITNGGANIVMTGVGAGTNGNGIVIQNTSTQIYSTSGNLTLTGTGAGTGADIFVTGSTLGSASMTGNITLVDDSLTLTSSTITTQNGITVKPRTASTTIGIAGGTGTLQLTSAVLSELHADVDADGGGVLTIGGVGQSGGINLGAYAGWNSGVTFGSTGGIAVGGNQSLTTGTRGVALAFNGPTSLGATVDVTASAGAGSIAFTGPVSLSGNSAVNAQGSIAFASTVDGAYNFALNNSGSGGISLGGALGNTTALGNVTISSASSLSLPSIRASTLTAQTVGAYDLSLAPGTVLSASGAGTAVTLASGRNFVNNAGPSAIALTGGGRSLIYSTSPASDTAGGLTNNFVRYSCSYGGACPSFPASGNGWLYSATPLLTVTPNAVAVTYGNGVSLAGYSYTLSGYNSGDLANDTVTGTLNGGTAYSAGSNVGSYAINYANGSLSDVLGYGFTYANASSGLSVNKASLSITTDNQTRLYGVSNPGFTGSITGVYGSDGITVTRSTLATAGSNVGSYSITDSLIDPNGKLGNYTIASNPNGTLTVNPATLTVAADNQSKIYGTVNPTLTGSITGQYSGDGITAGQATTAVQGSNVGTYSITNSLSDPNSKLGNYTIVNNTGTLSVTPASLTVTADSLSRTYGQANPILTGSLSGVYSGDTITVSRATAATQGSDVGSYGILNTLADAGNRLSNYTVINSSGTLTIGQASLTVNADSISRVYGTNNPVFTGSLSGVYAGDTITASRASSAGAGSDIGTYSILNTLSDPNNRLGNYSVVNNAGTLTVTRANLNVTADTLNITYGSVIPTLTGTLSGLYAPDAITVSRATTATQGSNVGGYSITNTLSDPNSRLNNYLVTNNPGTLAIDRATLTVTADSASRVYGTGNPGFTGTLTGVYAGDTITAGRSTSATTGSNVGSYAIANTLSDPGSRLGNYTIVNDAGTLTVTKADLNVTADNRTAVYGTVLPTLTGTLSGVYSGDTITVGRSTSAVQGSDVGGYAITNTLSDPNSRLGNYNVTNNSGTLTLTQASLNVNADSLSRLYGQANPGFTGSLGGVYGSDSITVGRSSTASAGSSVGSYAIVNTLSDPNGKLFDYNVTNTAGTLSVGQATLTVTADNQARIYGTVNPSLTGSITGEYSGDGITAGQATTATQGSNIGTYGITNALSDPNSKLGNYTIVDNTGTLTVNPASLTITTDDQLRLYGTNNPSFTGTLTGVYGSDGITVSRSTLATAGSNVGSYSITDSLVDPNGKLGNYTVASNPNGTLTVNPATLTVAADNQARIYGTTNPTLTGSITGEYSGDGITAGQATAATQGSNVGTYSIANSLSDPNGKLGNYTLVDNAGTLTVNPASLSITTDDQTRIYGTSNLTFTGSITGVYGSDGITVARGTIATAGSNVGSYGITGSLNDPNGRLSNYTVASNPNGTLTVTPASLTVTADSLSRTYGQANPTLTGSLSGVYSGDIITVSRTTAATQGSDVGGYSILNTLVDGGNRLSNYTVTNSAGTLTVNPATLTVAADNQTKIYGNADPALTYSASGLFGSDAISGALSRSAGETVAGGPYAIGQGTLSAGSNYSVSYTGANLAITARPLTIDADDAARATTDPDPVFGYIVTGWLAGDPHAAVNGVSLATLATAGSPTGTYAINASGGTVADSNYALGYYLPGILTITAPTVSALPGTVPSPAPTLPPVTTPTPTPQGPPPVTVPVPPQPTVPAVPVATDAPPVITATDTLPTSILHGNYALNGNSAFANGSNGPVTPSLAGAPDNDAGALGTGQDETETSQLADTLNEGDRHLAPAASPDENDARPNKLYKLSAKLIQLLTASPVNGGKENE